MEPRRRGWLTGVLLVWANVLLSRIAALEEEGAVVKTMVCTNDMKEKITCELMAEDCSSYSLTFTEQRKQMWCEQWAPGRCSCFLKEQILPIFGASHTVAVWRGERNLGSKVIEISETILASTPTLVSINESNGIFEVRWRSNVDFDDVIAVKVDICLTKDGATKVYSAITPTTVEGLKVYQIPSGDLEPSATYMVCVRSYVARTSLKSNCSNEMELTTHMSPSTLTSIVVVGLCLAVILVTVSAFVCFMKIKALWGFNTCPKPKIIMTSPSEQKLLKPSPPIITTVAVEPLTSDDSKPWLTASDVLAGAPPLDRSHFLCDSGLCPSSSSRTEDAAFGSFGFENRSYFSVLPDLGQQGSEVTASPELVCDPAYHGADSYGDQRLLDHLLQAPGAPPTVATEMGYQVHEASPAPLPQLDDSSCSSVCSASGSGCGEELEDGPPPPDPDGTLQVDFSYQSFQSLLDPPSTHDPDTTGPAAPPDGSASSTLPFLALLCGEQEAAMITESGYQSVEPPQVW